jgi:hypothetical protein
VGQLAQNTIPPELVPAALSAFLATRTEPAGVYWVVELAKKSKSSSVVCHREAQVRAHPLISLTLLVVASEF